MGVALSKGTDMPDNPQESSDLQRLHANVDAEIAQAQRSEDPDGPPDPELQAYEVSLAQPPRCGCSDGGVRGRTGADASGEVAG